MSRIAKLDPEAWDEGLRALVGSPSGHPLELGPFGITAHVPEIAKGLAQFGGALRANRTLPERLVELVRLRIAFHNQCRSCMAIRYESAVDGGLEEGAVCSLERPQEAADLSPAEKAAIDYGERMATNHLSIDDAVYDGLRLHLSEAQIVELGLWVGFCVGIGRLLATWDITEDLPAAFQDKAKGPVGPWAAEPVVVARRLAD